MSFHIRPAVKADITSLCEIGLGYTSFAVSERIRFYEAPEVEEWIGSPDDNLFLVADFGDRIAGFLFCKIMSSHWAMLDNFYVLPEFGGIGCATALLDALDTRLRSGSIQYVSTLCAEEDDPASAAWLLRCGFSRKRKYFWFERFVS